MTFVIISGGIDLSVGSIVALLRRGAGERAAGAAARSARDRWPASPSARPAASLNGLLITRGRLPPFIATLGMMSVARGARPRLHRRAGRSPASRLAFRSLATGRVLGIPAPVLVRRARLRRRAPRAARARASAATSTRSAATRRPRGSRAWRCASTRRWSTCCAGADERAGGGPAHRAAQLRAADRRHDVRARRDRRHRDRRHQPAGRRGHARRHADRRADHGRAAQRPEPARRLVVPAADRDRRRDHRARCWSTRR